MTRSIFCFLPARSRDRPIARLEPLHGRPHGCDGGGEHYTLDVGLRLKPGASDWSRISRTVWPFEKIWIPVSLANRTGEENPSKPEPSMFNEVCVKSFPCRLIGIDIAALAAYRALAAAFITAWPSRVVKTAARAVWWDYQIEDSFMRVASFKLA